ncbi:hypothetical protein D9611_002651 [Ephemerocybe angulata]|uniref:DUF1857 family protein n=1 Tax=Ephemerocybe angulata TaxID=980116 RepID=A0A8H5C1C0_9AGAR|nr:hypothetical protein D9611_002651 [Tulosesus angulatus]
MSKPSIACSRKVNPEGVPKLSAAQVWKGLTLKARDPVSFIPIAKSSEIIEDLGNTFTRRVVLGDNPPITEVIVQHEGAIIYFESPETGHKVTNILSYDENNELILTYCFANGIPGQKFTDQVPAPEVLNQSAGKSVEKTLEVIRRMVADGTIKEE